MSLKSGTRLGPYEIVSAVGVGGMGEVFRARDTKLNREVAIKVLPEMLAGDPDRLARFRREAQVLASLNHPNIAQIYGIEGDGPGQSALAIVMELVEGETLAERIARGALPLDEAVAIATQIADALEAAHEQGVIHRDLKPANVKLRDDGTVKVLDFGLAKALDANVSGASADAMNSPTMSARATAMGMVLGTAAYMAPEQAKGKATDRRGDVWAFGVVLFEMITGRQVFEGETASEVMASVMKEEPDWTRLPANLPAPIRRLLRRCLEKDPRKRLSSIGDARLELGERESAPATSAVPAPTRSPLWLVGAGLAGAALTAVAMLFVLPALRPVAERQPSRVSVLGPPGLTLLFDATESAISPDGRVIVFTSSDSTGATKLWLRPLDALEARPIAGTEGGRLPFWSPDGNQIAFFGIDKLKKVPASGGTVEPLCDAKDGRGGTWGTANVIVFAPSNAGPLLQVSANGGEPKPVTALDTTRGETGHRFPWFLPDGHHFLFAALPSKNQKFDLLVGSIDGPARQAVTSAESSAVYVDPGYLLFSRQNALVAQRFDAGKLQLSGEPVAIGDAPSSTGAQYAAGRAVSASTNGTLAYLGDRQPNTKLLWLDRSGRNVGGLAVPDGRYQEISFSPDGRRVALTRFASQSATDIWIINDVDRGGATRFTFAPGANQEVLWSPDSSRIVFASDRNGRRDIFIKPSNGATPEQVLYTSAMMFKDPRTWSPDNKFVVFEQLDPQTNRDLMMLPLDGDHTPKPYLQTPFNEQYAAISPDGRWIAYSSDETGRFEIYVDSFPTPRNKYRVTDGGGLAPYWRKDSREIAIVSNDARALLLADVLPGADFRAGPTREAITLAKDNVWIQPAPDFQRFLVSVPVAETTTSTLTVVFDWLGTLKKK